MSSIRSSHNPGVLRDRRGFTLMELLVSLMISTMLVTVIFRLMQGNSQYVRMQSAREEVAQNARAALDLIASDLRAVPPGGFTRIEPDSIRFYLPRGWGVLCNSLTSTSTTAWVLFPTGVLSTTDVFEKPQWGLAVEQTADPSAPTGSWQFVTQPTQQTTGDPCATVQPALDDDLHLRLGFNRTGSTAFVANSAMTISPGTQVLLFEEVAYDVAESTSGTLDGFWIRRMVGQSSGAANMQPLAGPVPESGALRFTYLAGDGVTETTTATDVRQIRLQIIAQSRAETGSGPSRRPTQMDTVTTNIVLRNIVN